MKNKLSTMINACVALITLALLGCGGGGGDSSSSKVTCANFSYQEDAQAYFESHNAKQLDRDSDGIACESLPSRPTPAPGPAPLPSPTPSPTPTPTPTSSTAEGLWIGTTNTFRSLTGIVLENGTYWVLYSSPNNSTVIAGVVQGSGTSLNGSFSSSNAKDFNLEGKGIDNATVSGSYITKRSFNGAVTYSSLNPSVTFTSTYDPSYEEIPRLTRLAGTYAGTAAVVGGTESASLTVTSSGAISGFGMSGCEFSGTATPHLKGNVFDLTVTFGGGVCLNGTSTVTGIGYFDVTSGQLYGAALNSGRSNGFIFVGTKP